MDHAGQVVIAYDNGSGRRGCIAGWAREVTQEWDISKGNTTIVEWLPGSPKGFHTQQPDWAQVPPPPADALPSAAPRELEAS